MIPYFYAEINYHPDNQNDENALIGSILFCPPLRFLGYKIDITDLGVNAKFSKPYSQDECLAHVEPYAAALDAFKADNNVDLKDFSYDADGYIRLSNLNEIDPSKLSDDMKTQFYDLVEQLNDEA